MKRLRCSLGRHRYRRVRNEDGEFHGRCEDCGNLEPRDTAPGSDPVDDDPSVEGGALIREAAKLVVLDPADRVLLFRYPHGNESGRPFWTVPGGGVTPGETHEEAALRELREETGIHAEIGPLIWIRTDVFPSGETTCRQKERHYLVQVPEAASIEAPGPDPSEPFTEARWWSVDELESAAEDVFPRRLASLLRILITDGPSSVPLDVGV
jgi:8-oxo-dGTP pyrophosphatase MutT (NUDIX family)